MDPVLVESMPAFPVMDHVSEHDASSSIPDFPHNSPAPLTPSKRPHPGEDSNAQQLDAQPCGSGIKHRALSPSLSETSSALSTAASVPPPSGLDGTTPGPADQPAAKRRRLTPAEKLVKEQEKAEKLRAKEQRRVEREEQKRVKDEEKRVKDEDKRQKNEVLEEKKRERDLKKQEKELQKQREDEAKAKKERAQQRMTAFFAKPKVAAHTTPSKVDSLPSNTLDDGLTWSPSRSTAKTPAPSDYQKTFLPFEAPSNAVVAPANRFSWDADATAHALKLADTWFAGHGSSRKPLKKLLDLSPQEQASRGAVLPSTSALVTRIAGTSTTPGDSDAGNPRAALRALPVKYIYFHQDVRPPYIGTISKGESASQKIRIARCPFRRARVELDYDDDSEAEWEEPEEGEDLDSEADEEESLGDPEELEEFLDDDGQDDAQRQRKKFLNSDMQPVSTGLCWEGPNGKTVKKTEILPHNPEEFRMESLIGQGFPIDPFSSAYWQDSQDYKPANDLDPTGQRASNASRQPLLARPNIAMNSLSPSGKPTPPKASADAKAASILSGPELDRFKEVVDGSDLNKVGILAVLKKRLPKVPNTVLNATLSSVAARVGLKEAEKRWRLLA